MEPGTDLRGNAFAIGTLVERATRYVMLVHLTHGRAAERVRDALVETVQRLPAHLVRSPTWDQGSEMAAHSTFTLAIDIPVYFCDPAGPWQHGSNQNTNGLLLPQGHRPVAAHPRTPGHGRHRAERTPPQNARPGSPGRAPSVAAAGRRGVAVGVVALQLGEQAGGRRTWCGPSPRRRGSRRPGAPRRRGPGSRPGWGWAATTCRSVWSAAPAWWKPMTVSTRTRACRSTQRGSNFSTLRGPRPNAPLPPRQQPPSVWTPAGPPARTTPHHRPARPHPRHHPPGQNPPAPGHAGWAPTPPGRLPGGPLQEPGPPPDPA